MVQKTKRFIFAIEYKEYGMQSVDVPVNFTQEEAERYVEEHWDEIKLPRSTNYMANSAVPNFDYSSFEEG